MKKLLLGMILSLASSVFAQTTWNVTITNITKSQIFSPPIAAAHDGSTYMFRLGQGPTVGLYTMAEDGDNSVMAAELAADSGVGDVSTADGPVMPGQSVTIQISTSGSFNRVSVAGMLVSTNDAFFGVSGAVAPTLSLKAGVPYSMQFLALAYDAGSETNSEDCASIPGPPCGNGGVRDTSGAEGYVHISSGVHGIGDVDAAAYTWDGPVALIEISRAN